MAAISLGEMPNNRYIREFPNGETQSATRAAVSVPNLSVR